MCIVKLLLYLYYVSSSNKDFNRGHLFENAATVFIYLPFLIIAMNPKAKELYHKFLTCQPDEYLAKQCCYICIDEIIKEIKKYTYGHPILVSHKTEYWNEVKKEIEKL